MSGPGQRRLQSWFESIMFVIDADGRSGLLGKRLSDLLADCITAVGQH